MKSLLIKAVSPRIYWRIGFFCFLYFSIFANPLAAESQFERDIQKAAQTGDAESQYALALLYEHGSETLVRDSTKALFWLKKAGEEKVAGACLYLGLRYEYGNGVDQDYESAHCWYLCAASQDWPIAQFFLAHLYEKGKGVAVSKRTALAWYSLASEHGYPKAESESERLRKELGSASRNGLGLLQKKLMEKNATHCN